MTRKRREDRACETIIAGILRGFTSEDWKRVFEKIDKNKSEDKRRRLITRKDLDEPFTI